MGGRGGLAGEQAEQQQSQRVIVGAIINDVLITFRAKTHGQSLFRGHGRGGADEGAGAVAIFALERAKIGQFEMCAAFVDQDVAEFQVTVHETGIVNNVQSRQDLPGPVENPFQIWRRRIVPLLLRQPVTEIGRHPLHHQHRLSLHLAMIDQGDDVAGLIRVQTG